MLATNKQEYSRTDTRNSLTDFSRDLLLRDGAMLRFRALRPGARGALKDLLSRWSPLVRAGYCIRIPMFASQEFSEIAAIGMIVIVYDSDPLAQTDSAKPVKRQRERPIGGSPAI
jgi:hypothetical protein